jgi:hypothetical protein
VRHNERCLAFSPAVTQVFLEGYDLRPQFLSGHLEYTYYINHYTFLKVPAGKVIPAEILRAAAVPDRVRRAWLIGNRHSNIVLL